MLGVLLPHGCVNLPGLQQLRYLGSPPTPMMQRRPVSAIYSQARMIKVYINLFEEEYKCAQVCKHKAAHENKNKNIIRREVQMRASS